MAYEQSFCDEDVSHKQKWDSVSQLPENSNGSFDCSICLESCNEPVVTLCGHLYCWPCIYKWLHVESSSFESDEHEESRCPVCKASISSSSLVPLYGRGEARKRQLELTIPARPPAPNTFVASSPSVSSDSNQDLIQRPLSSYSSMTPTLGSPTASSSFNPTINMVSEIVFAGMFGSSETNMFAYPYSNSYPLVGNGSPRLRRHEIQVDKSLNRLSIFLFCCMTLCLILF